MIAHSDRPSAADVLADRPPCWATVSPPETALLQLEPQASLLPPVEIASRGKARLHLPGRWLRFGRGLVSTRAKGRGGRRPSRGRGGRRPSMSARRLRGREAFGLRQLAGAFEERHCARRPTAPLPASTNDRTFWGPDHSHRWRHQFHPGPWVGVPAQATSACRQPSSACTAPLAPPAAAEVAGGR